jgi:uncharacterized protein (TIGR02646 family)
MIRKPVPPAPAALAVAAAKEAERLKTYKREKGSLKGFEFKAYSDPDVVRALKAAFDGKCAYCEFSYSGGAPPDVEHYRPKGGVEVNGQLQEPGYFWLAAEWTNLLPSCLDCNRKRYHDFPDIPAELRGKANKFPIANPAARAKKAGDEANEQRLLLHPYLDNPEDHIRFVNEGAVQAVPDANGGVSRMGVESIQTYGLDRPDLSALRRDTWLMVSASVKAVKKAVVRKAQHPGDPDYDDALSDAIEVLARHTVVRGPFQAMVQSLTKDVKSLIT